MNKGIKSMIVALVLLSALPAFAQADGSDKYKLVWEDNFSKPVLDETNWTIVVNGKGGGNRELQYYRKENISVGKEPVSGESCLIITAKKENYKFHRATSGRLSTKGKVSVKYGKIEARMKLPKTANGLWPAFWMLGSDYPQAVWPKCGEIDILEMGNANGIEAGTQDKLFNGACHWGERFNHGRYPNFAKATTSTSSLQDDFHLFTLIWDQNAIRMYVDLDKNPQATPYFEMPVKGENVADNPGRYFHKEYFVLFNLAVGGNFTKIHHIKDITALNSGEAKMYVDYVRIYQKGQTGESFNSK